MNIAYDAMKLCAASMLCAVLAALTGGCSKPEMPTPDRLAAFQKAGPMATVVDVDALLKAKIPTSSYRLASGDLLSILISPPIKTGEIVEMNGGAAEERTGEMLRRVQADGKVLLPLVDSVDLAGKTLVEAEDAIATAYHPSHVLQRPSVVVRVAEYTTHYVEIFGGVVNPGRFQLRSDEMSLVSALMKAGNVIPTGAQAVRIHRPGQSEGCVLALPVVGVTQPFEDITLSGGELIEVVKLKPKVVTIVGLVNTQGTFPYPPDASYNLVQALGIAGGPDPIGDPRYVSIYRQDEKGQIISARFDLTGGASDPKKKYSVLNDDSLSHSAFVAVKPGDIIVVEHDARTYTRGFLAKALVFTIGGSADMRTEGTFYKDLANPGGVRTR